MPAYSQRIEFSVESRQQSRLIAALTAADEQFTCTCPGFIGASVLASEDGLRVLHQVIWRSREDCQAALRNIETGVQDVQALMRQHRVRAATFSSFEVMSQVAPRA